MSPTIEYVTLNRGIESIVDGPFGSNLASEHYVDEGARVVRLGNIGQMAFRDDDKAFISIEQFNALKRHAVSPGDLLVAGLGDEINAVGRACVAPVGLGPALVKADCFRLRVLPLVFDPRYIGWYLNSSLAAHLVELESRGATRVRATPEAIARIMVPLHTIEMQRRIADFLDDQVALIDRIICARRRQADALLGAARSRAEELVWRGLRDEPLGATGVDPAPLAPLRWDRIRNKNLLREATELSKNGSEDLLSVSHLTGVTLRSEKTVTMFMAESLVGYKVVRPGDLVINTLWAWMGALGVSDMHGIVSPAYGVYRPISPKFDRDYFDILYRSSAYVCEMTRHSKGVWSSRLRLYPESFLGLRVVAPPRDEQNEIVAVIHREVGEFEPFSQDLNRSVGLLSDLKRSLITSAVTGKFDESLADGSRAPL